MDIDLTTLTDEEIGQLLTDAHDELARRTRLQQTPDQIATLTLGYINDGGNKADILAKVEST